MLSFFKRKKNTIDIPVSLPFTTDMHSHILPGIDDGAPDINISLELITGLKKLGIDKCIATPHIIGDLYRNNAASIAAALQKTKNACSEAGINMELSAGAEYMLDDYFMDLLRKKEPLLTLQDNIILTEISYSTTPENLNEIVAAITGAGYIPVMAHPERYHYYQNNFDKFYALAEMGFILQVNLLSVTGYYGKKAEKAVKFILEKKLATLVGTDCHHQQHLAAINDTDNRLMFEEYFRDKDFNNLTTIS
jgi:tyrosine-protein phosphatase YwqE